MNELDHPRLDGEVCDVPLRHLSVDHETSTPEYEINMIREIIIVSKVI